MDHQTQQLKACILQIHIKMQLYQQKIKNNGIKQQKQQKKGLGGQESQPF